MGHGGPNADKWSMHFYNGFQFKKVALQIQICVTSKVLHLEVFLEKWLLEEVI